jgi:predicted MFS family arabinose efflux permease
VKGIARKYLEFVRRPHVGRLLLVAFFSRMPIGMVAFSMLMFLREALGNYALAGLAVGINFVSMAIAAPVQGRIMDRHGPERLLRVTAVVTTLALCAMAAAALARMPFAVIAVLAALAGAFANPITTLTRTIWRHLFDDEDDRRTAFALDAVMIEFNFTVGPAIVALMLAVASPTAAFALTIVVVAGSAVLFMASGAMKLFKGVGKAERHLLGPLTEPRLLVVFFAMLGITTGFGILEVGYPAFSTYLGMGALAGILLAINSLGSATGGALYGGLHFKASLERQFAVCMMLMAIPFGLHAAFLHPIAYGVLAFVSGALIAPTLTIHAVLVSRLAPPKYATEAFTWSSTFIVAGLGTGMAVGGALAESAGIPTMFVVAATLIMLMGVGVWIALSPSGAARVQAAD